MKKVVGTMFFKDGKLLIDKPRKRPTFQMIGGSVEEGESVLDAAIRECHEELGNNAIFNCPSVTIECYTGTFVEKYCKAKHLRYRIRENL